MGGQGAAFADAQRLPRKDEHMLDADTRTLIAAARARTQFEMSARLIMPAKAPSDPRELERLAGVWADARVRVADAIGRHDALRILRNEKVRHGMILAGSAAGWREFFEKEAALVGDERIAFRHYTRPSAFDPP